MKLYKVLITLKVIKLYKKKNAKFYLLLTALKYISNNTWQMENFWSINQIISGTSAF